ncbi:MAG TPA: DinB family protein [Balneolaceae bacterium]
MSQQYSYSWFIQQFENSKADAEKFILSVDEAQFLQSPASDKWCIAECYSHLIKFGALYYKNLAGELWKEVHTENPDQAFNSRWIFQKVVNYFEPPYKIKIKTFEQMKPDPVSGYSRIELLDEYINLQDQLITLLKQFKHRQVDLRRSKMPHPIFPRLKLTLSESFALLETHQRRHQWQAEQVLRVVSQRNKENSQSSAEE